MRKILCILALGIFVQSLSVWAVNVEQLYVRSSFDNATQTTTAELSFLVDRPLEEVIAVMDPQNWDVCSRYFDQHDVIDPKTGEVDPSPPTPGSNWEGITIENVTFPFLGLSAARIINHLWWRSVRNNDGGTLRHRYDYKLYQSLSTRFLASSQEGGVTVDDGWVTIEENWDGRWKVTGLKIIHFDLEKHLLSKTVNSVSPKLFKKVLSDIGFDLLNCQI